MVTQLAFNNTIDYGTTKNSPVKSLACIREQQLYPFMMSRLIILPVWSLIFVWWSSVVRSPNWSAISYSFRSVSIFLMFPGRSVHYWELDTLHLKSGARGKNISPGEHLGAMVSEPVTSIWELQWWQKLMSLNEREPMISVPFHGLYFYCKGCFAFNPIAQVSSWQEQMLAAIN